MTLPSVQTPLRTRLFRDGTWTDAADGAEFEVLDPADGSVIATVADGTVQDALACVDAAERAAADWAATPPRRRSEILSAAFEAMTARQDEIAALITRENGKAYPDAVAETRYAAEFFRWFAEEAVRLSGQLGQAPSGANRIMVSRAPIGISFLVTPWNFPAAMATRKLGPALAAGCTAIVKPASETPLTALLIADLLHEAGVPRGVVNVLPSRRSGPVADAVLHDPRVRKLSFTGSTEVGRHLLHLAADQVISCAMELGGNAPFVVLADADLDAAVEGALVAKMRNAGEACTAANRFYVHRSIAGEFARRLADRMSALRVGPGTDRSNDVGPLVNAAAVDKVEELVADAVRRGARVVTGGVRLGGPGHYYAPTVLEAVPTDAQILAEEIFGPVAPVVAFDVEDEAVELANATEYGLVSYLYTEDLRRGMALAERLESGMVGLNRGLVSDPAAPFGGVKQSGLGREGSHVGIEEFTETKYVAVNW